MDSNITEVFNDFQIALSKIDFSGYNPNSDDFMTALHLGLMWYILNYPPTKNTEIIAEVKSENGIEEELNDAKKYLQMYIDTKDELYKNMSRDELNHASILIKKASSKLPAGEEKLKLKNYEETYKEVLNQIEKI